eukprot:14865881-Alexandrium_andersonii.AAC.1
MRIDCSSSCSFAALPHLPQLSSTAALLRRGGDCSSCCSSVAAAAPAAARLPVAPAADEGRLRLQLQLSC